MTLLQKLQFETTAQLMYGDQIVARRLSYIS
jgi:hypothetical protein